MRGKEWSDGQCWHLGYMHVSLYITPLVAMKECGMKESVCVCVYLYDVESLWHKKIFMTEWDVCVCVHLCRYICVVGGCVGLSLYVIVLVVFENVVAWQNYGWCVRCCNLCMLSRNEYNDGKNYSMWTIGSSTSLKMSCVVNCFTCERLLQV